VTQRHGDLTASIQRVMEMDDVDGEVDLLNSMDVTRVRQIVRQLALESGFSLIKQTKLVTAASELARNAVKYADGGVVGWKVMSAAQRVGLRLIFEDHGPGIANLDLALSDGWSTGGGLGLGLPGARRLVDEFVVESQLKRGTRVTVTLWK
jgi:serine/threonine-protein kinase RsbT